MSPRVHQTSALPARRVSFGADTVEFGPRGGAPRAYAAIDRIEWPDGFCRHDIGARAVEREQGRA